MNYETMESHNVQLRPQGNGDDQDIAVRVDERNLPQARGNYINLIHIDNVLHHLQHLFGLDEAAVNKVREDLEDGRDVTVKIDCLHSQLVMAGFIQQ
jgi:hypothetical protein